MYSNRETPRNDTDRNDKNTKFSILSVLSVDIPKNSQSEEIVLSVVSVLLLGKLQINSHDSVNSVSANSLISLPERIGGVG